MHPGPASSTSPTYASGWYPDPLGRYEFRYYNGLTWTGDVSNNGVRLLDPLPDPASGGYRPVGVVGPGGPGAAGGPPEGNTLATTAFVLAIASIVLGWVPFVCFIVVVAAILAVVFGVIGLRRSGQRDGVGHGMALTGLVLTPLAFASIGIGMWLTAISVREFTKFADIGTYELHDDVCTVTDGVARYEGTVTNTSSSSHSYHLVIEFTRPGTTSVLYTAVTEVDNVAPGASGQWQVRHSVTQTALECRVGAISGPIPFGD